VLSTQRQSIDKTCPGIKIMAGRYLAYGKVWRPKVSQKRPKKSLMILSTPGAMLIRNWCARACSYTDQLI